MELIPILSTIILVATISTFILAVGAYILYKVQEGRADKLARQKINTEKAEVVEPASIGGRQLVLEEPEAKTMHTAAPQHHYRSVQPVSDSYHSTQRKVQKERTKLRRKPTEPKFLKFTSGGYVTTKDDKNSGAVRWR